MTGTRRLELEHLRAGRCVTAARRFVDGKPVDQKPLAPALGWRSPASRETVETIEAIETVGAVMSDNPVVPAEVDLPAVAAPPSEALPRAATLRLDATSDLRRFLLDQMTAVAEGKRSPEQIKSICALAEQVYKTAKLELDYASAIAKLDKVAPLRLVNDD